MENKQNSKAISNYEHLLADYKALQLQVKPNSAGILSSIFKDEMSLSGGHGLKKLQLEHQVTLSLLNDSLEESKAQTMRNDKIEEEMYSLKKDNIELLKEKNELRVLQEEEVSCQKNFACTLSLPLLL